MKHISRLIPILPSFLVKSVHDFFAWILPYSSHPEKYDMIQRQKKVHQYMGFVTKKLKLDIILEGEENLPKEGNACLFSNHTGASDPVVFLSALPENFPLTFVAKKEAKKIPIVGRIITALQGQFMDRKDLKQSLKVMMHVQDDLSKGKRSWLIFPEGTRLKDKLQLIAPFHSGTFRNPMRAKVPLIPIATYGISRALKFNLHFHKFPVHIKILKPLTYEEYKDLTTEEVATLLHDRIQQEITYNLRIKDHLYNIKNNEKEYKFNNIY